MTQAVKCSCTNKATRSMTWMFSHDLLYKSLMFVAWLICSEHICCRGEYRKRMKRREEHKGREKKERGWQRGERGERWQRQRCPQACRLVGSPGVGSRLQRGDTQQRLMEGLWFSISIQLSLSAWNPPTRHGIITIRPPVSQMSSEERSR